jgi:hypothetical protein
VIRQRWLSGAFAASGALAIAGALLPWLTLYAGLYRYSGVTGLYGRLILAIGAVAVIAGAFAPRVQSRWLRLGGVALGITLLGFAAWLYTGMQEVINRPEAVMAVAQPGPGLTVVLAAGALMSATAVLRTR